MCSYCTVPMFWCGREDCRLYMTPNISQHDVKFLIRRIYFSIQLQLVEQTCHNQEVAYFGIDSYSCIWPFNLLYSDSGNYRNNQHEKRFLNASTHQPIRVNCVAKFLGTRKTLYSTVDQKNSELRLQGEAQHGLSFIFRRRAKHCRIFMIRLDIDVEV